jgi:hypothetical protein
MAPSITIYNHTRARFLSGANLATDEYIVNLYTVLPANLTATTKSAAESWATQLSTANGYTQDAKVLSGVTITTVTTDDAMFDADDVSWTATGGSLEGNFAMVYNNTDTDDPPVFRVDFDGAVTAAAGIPLVISWNASGIFGLT